MPIYEFKCSKCEHFFEILIMSDNEEKEMSCPECKSEDFERIMSVTTHAVGSESGAKGPSVENRSCSAGSCTTYDIPGPSR